MPSEKRRAINSCPAWLWCCCLLAACSPTPDAVTPATPATLATSVSLQADSQSGRWYTTAQAQEGLQLYGQYCVDCHGPEAASTSAWKTPDANGDYPPPPLDGSAHAWHHPLALLDRVIRDGGAPIGGVMPAWGSILDADQRLAVIAGLQTRWSPKIYNIWLEREQASRE
jgi:mono/diheme cytochrome c family protein